MKQNTDGSSDKGKVLAAVAAVIGIAALVMGQEQLTVTTYTPAPAMIVNGLTSTGPRHTILARDGATNGAMVGVRLGAGVNPAMPLDVGPRDNANSGAAIMMRGAGGNPYAYLDNFTGDLRAVTQNVGAAGETERARLGNDGRVYTTGSRTYLQGTDGTWHWIMSGGVTEGVNNALGFNPGTKTISPGPGWTLSGANVKAWTGTYTGSNWGQGFWIGPLGFTPTAAICASNQIGRAGSWDQVYCSTTVYPASQTVFLNVVVPCTGCSFEGWVGLPSWSFNVLVIGQ